MICLCWCRRSASVTSTRSILDVSLLSVRQRQRWSAQFQYHLQRQPIPAGPPEPRGVLSTILRLRCRRGRGAWRHSRPRRGVCRRRRAPGVVFTADLRHHVKLGELRVSRQCHVRNIDTGQRFGLRNGQSTLLCSLPAFLHYVYQCVATASMHCSDLISIQSWISFNPCFLPNRNHTHSSIPTDLLTHRNRTYGRTLSHRFRFVFAFVTATGVA